MKICQDIKTNTGTPWRF